MSHRASFFVAASIAAVAAAACGSTVQQGAGGGGSTSHAASSSSSSSGSGGATSVASSGTGGATTSVASSGTGGATTTSVSSSGTGGATTSVASSGSGGATSVSASSSSAVASSSSSSSGNACAADPPLMGACAPKASCMVNGSTCLAHVNQAASTKPSFRMSQLSFTKPVAFAQGLVSNVLAGSITPSDQACQLNGSGTASWLLRFDTVAGTLETGGAKPAMAPAGPYAFVDQMIVQGAHTFHVQPVTLMGPIGATCAFQSSLGDVIFPFYLDAQGAQVVLLPLRSVRFHDGAVSADHGCIGRFNAAGLDPANSCLPDAQHPDFLAGASLDAFITLEDADTVVVAALNETLCVVLSGNAAMYGTPGAGNVTVCKRTAANKILFKGDWCAATNAAASAACFDALDVTATFAAQAVTIQ